MRMKFFCRRLFIAALLCTANASVNAAAYPDRPLRFLIPFPPGGGADNLARILGSIAGESLGQQIVIDNRAGAGGNIAAEAASKAAPDGYTLLQSNISHVISASLYRKLNYDIIRDFVPVTQLASIPYSAPSKSNPAAASKDNPRKRMLRSFFAGSKWMRTKLIVLTIRGGCYVDRHDAPWRDAGRADGESVLHNRAGDQSARIPADFTTGAHFAICALMCAPSSCGVPCTSSPPRCAEAPVEPAEKLTFPGLAFACARRSFTDFTGIAGCTTSTLCASTAMLTGAKSAIGS